MTTIILAARCRHPPATFGHLYLLHILGGYSWLTMQMVVNGNFEQPGNSLPGLFFVSVLVSIMESDKRGAL